MSSALYLDVNIKSISKLEISIKTRTSSRAEIVFKSIWHLFLWLPYVYCKV